MAESEYLVAYGAAGEFGRFRSVNGLCCERGDRVVIRTHRGVEAGQVLRPAAPGHARYLPNTTVGQLLRRYDADDDRAATERQSLGAGILEQAARLAAETALPLEILDIEVLLDGEHAVIHYLGDRNCDVRPLVSSLSRSFSLGILLEDLAQNASEPASDRDNAPAGQCGSCGEDGSCGTCSSGGCASCGSHASTDTAMFAGLREKMERKFSLL